MEKTNNHQPEKADNLDMPTFTPELDELAESLLQDDQEILEALLQELSACYDVSLYLKDHLPPAEALAYVKKLYTVFDQLSNEEIGHLQRVDIFCQSAQVNAQEALTPGMQLDPSQVLVDHHAPVADIIMQLREAVDEQTQRQALQAELTEMANAKGITAIRLMPSIRYNYQQINSELLPQLKAAIDEVDTYVLSIFQPMVIEIHNLETAGKIEIDKTDGVNTLKIPIDLTPEQLKFYGGFLIFALFRKTRYFDLLENDVKSDDGLSSLVNILFYLGITEDVHLQGLTEVKDEWLPKEASALDAVNLAASVVRNLCVADAMVNEENFSHELERLQGQQARYADVPLFTGRHVVSLYHQQDYEDMNLPWSKEIDVWRSGSDLRFGKPARQELICQHASSHEFVRASKDTAELAAQKELILTQIETAPSPMTFHFEGHGGEEGLFLSAGEANPNGGVNHSQGVRITPDELAQAYAQRYSQTSPSQVPAEQDIFLLDACLMGTYVRHFYEALDGLGVTIGPICITHSEYGQVGYSDFPNPYGDLFASEVIVTEDGSPPTIGSLAAQQHHGRTNPTVLAPHPDFPSQWQQLH